MIKGTLNPIAAAAVFALGLSACSDKEAESTQAAQVPSAVTAPLPPRETEAERLAQEVVRIGGTQSDGAAKLVLAGDRFKSGKAAFEAGDKIAAIATLLENHPGSRVMIEGYTDDRGGNAVNQRLSAERARSVERALIERGIDASRIEVAGRGPAQPVASNDTAEGRAQNRRVELTFASDASQRVAEGGTAQSDAAR